MQLKVFSLKKKKKGIKGFTKNLTQCNNKGNQTIVGPLGPLCLVRGQEEEGGEVWVVLSPAPAGTSPEQQESLPSWPQCWAPCVTVEQ